MYINPLPLFKRWQRDPRLHFKEDDFDHATPGMHNDAANGQPFGPPTPPRDGLADIGDFYDELDFAQDPNYAPQLLS